MQTITFRDFEESPIQFVGALDFDRRGNGLGPRRLPAWTRPQVPQAMDVMVRMPSGVRLTFDTTSTRVELDVLTTRMVTPPAEPRSVAFDLQVDGGRPFTQVHNGGNTIILNPQKPDEFELVRGDPFTVVFDNLPATAKTCELWLPTNVFVELRSIALDDDASLSTPTTPDKRCWLHYGSSISHCAEVDHPTATWPAIAARLGGVDLFSLGFGGNCHLDQFVARTIRDQPADVISLKVGINIVNMDSMRERIFTPAIHGFLDTIREGKSDTPILLVSPIYCPSAETHPGPTKANRDGQFVTLPGFDEMREGCLTLTRMREIIENLVRDRRGAGDRNLYYLNGLSLFGAEDADDLPDALHPNPAGYIRMGERFAHTVFGDGGIFALG